MARLVTNVTKLYDATSTLPAYAPDPSTIRVLHVSDIHLNPACWQIIASLVEQYEVDVIVDSGDTMDHGTAAENGFLDPIEDLGAPYVWVRGNHDSTSPSAICPGLKNVHVLDDGRAVTVAGPALRGHRRPAVHAGPLDVARRRRRRAHGRAPASPPPCATSARAGTPVDIAVAHNPRRRPRDRRRGPARPRRPRPPPRDGGPAARHPPQDRGLHGRRRSARRESKNPDKIAASVLYLDRDTRRLQAWDEISWAAWA